MQLRFACTASSLVLCLYMSSACDERAADTTPNDVDASSLADACVPASKVSVLPAHDVDKLDMLFVIADSESMREEQGALKAQFPALLTGLTTGQRPNDPGNPFPPVKDLHVAVVSSDMGAVGVNDAALGCQGFGDDGILQHSASADTSGCHNSYPPFLAYAADKPQQISSVAQDLACIASVGTTGCGFEQPLEASFKALWPSVDRDEDGQPIKPNRYVFLHDSNGNGALGHGDRENLGFLRNDPVQGRSVIAVVVIADKDDCSSKVTEHFVSKQSLDVGDPLYNQDLALRCFYNKANLYEPMRYISGFKALRAGQESSVVFALIAGVPPILVDDTSYASVDWDSDTGRNAFYDQLQNDPRMQERIDSSRPAEDVRLLPSCVTATGNAEPPRRLVDVARGFGKKGLVKSICDVSQFGPALNAIVGLISKQLGSACLNTSLKRGSDGKVDVDVVWELPPLNTAPAATPTRCADRPFLSAPKQNYPLHNDRGGNNCVVTQVAVKAKPAPSGAGWYYDDFSSELAECNNGARARIAYTTDAMPPAGCVAKLVERDTAAGSTCGR